MDTNFGAMAVSSTIFFLLCFRVTISQLMWSTTKVTDKGRVVLADLTSDRDSFRDYQDTSWHGWILDIDRLFPTSSGLNLQRAINLTPSDLLRQYAYHRMGIGFRYSNLYDDFSGLPVGTISLPWQIADSQELLIAHLPQSKNDSGLYDDDVDGFFCKRMSPTLLRCVVTCGLYKYDTDWTTRYTLQPYKSYSQRIYWGLTPQAKLTMICALYAQIEFISSVHGICDPEELCGM